MIGGRGAVRSRAGRRGASFVEVMVLVALAIGVVLAGARLLGDSAKQTSGTLAEHVRSMTEVQSRATAITGANAGSTYAPQNAACDPTHGCEGPPAAPAGGPAAQPAATASAPAAAPERGIGDYALSFGKGVVVDGIGGTLGGLWNMVAHPVDTATGLYYVATNPVTSFNAVKSNVAAAWAEDPARVLGGGAFQIATIFTPAAVTKVATAAKIGEVAVDASTASKIATATKVATGTKVAEGTTAVAEGTTAAEAEAARAAQAANGCAGGVCGAAGNCFAAGTPVLTPHGEMPIERVAVGDVVLARHPQSGETREERVSELFVTEGRAVVDLALTRDDGQGGAPEHLIVTAEHPFFAEGRGFVPVRELDVGLHVETASGTATVSSLTSLLTPSTVYNFEVEDAHTYFVGHLAAWVHNVCAAQFEKSLSELKSPGERVAAVRQAVGDYAKAQGWTKDGKLSRINGRDVYRDPKTGKLYATDSQHGRIEVLDKRGGHLGEIDLDGKPTKPADPSGGHDLKTG